MKTALNGISLTGAATLYLIVGLAFLVTKIFFMYWVSGWFYSVGWWPIGALIRIVAWLEIMAVLVGVIFVVIGSIGALIDWLRHKQATNPR
jgi:hypothetical protein